MNFLDAKILIKSFSFFSVSLAILGKSKIKWNIFPRTVLMRISENGCQWMLFKSLTKLPYVHTLQRGHWSMARHSLSSMETDCKVDSTHHTELHTCFPRTDRHASLLIGWTNNVCHLHVRYNHNAQSLQFHVQCSDAMGWEKKYEKMFIIHNIPGVFQHTIFTNSNRQPEKKTIGKISAKFLAAHDWIRAVFSIIVKQGRH